MRSIREISRKGIEGGLNLNENVLRKIFASSNADEIQSLIYAAYCNRENKKLNKAKVLPEVLKRKIEFTKVKLSKVAEEFRSNLIKKQTESEKIFKAILKSINVPYKFQEIFYTETSFYIVDFYLPDWDVIIEIDGGYHTTPEQILKDQIREKTLKSNHRIRKIVRFTNKDITNTELVIKKVKEL